jgi:subtilisin family serine protease
MKLSIIGIIGVLLILLLVAGFIPDSQLIASAQGGLISSPGGWKISNDLHFTLLTSESDEKFSIIITFTEKPDIDVYRGMEHNERVQHVITALKTNAEESQKDISRMLAKWESQGKVQDIETFWIINGISFTASREVVEWLSLYPEVASIAPDRLFEAPHLHSDVQQIENNLQVINIQSLWEMGYRGEEIVIANLDTGVDINHPDLKNNWRGGNNSWFDPYGEHPDIPTDKNGHGTWTMGVMVGGSSSGSNIGAAPDAKWIAAKIFNDSGNATSTGIRRALQWILDPDGDPSTPDAPHVVNNSWGFLSTGCYLDFQDDLKALRAAGILPIFAAGNSGPGSNSSVSPANYPEAFSVGAVNNWGDIYTLSSRGPSACSGNLFPHIVAPGVTIKTTGLLEGYSSPTGTSMAAPHVTGILALLLNAYPSLTVEEQEDALLSSALDMGETGPDNVFGYGQVDALAAFNWLVDTIGEPENPAIPTHQDDASTNYIYLPALLNAP